MATTPTDYPNPLLADETGGGFASPLGVAAEPNQDPGVAVGGGMATGAVADRHRIAPDRRDPIRYTPDDPRNPDPSKPKNSYDLDITPGRPNPHNPGSMNVVDYASQLATDPQLALSKDMMMSSHLSSNAEVQKMMQAGSIDGNQNRFQMDPNRFDVDSKNVDTVRPKDAQGYNVETTFGKVGQQDIAGAVGHLDDRSVISDVPQVDTKGIATGVNSDGSINYTGQALQKYAAQDFTNIIDTSTAAGKLLAQTLGEGNYTDAKATLKGQLDILQNEFVDPVTGEAKIPSWAAGTARNVSKIAAFKGMSGTAATAAMSQALLEASIPIAQADSQFFQTLTLQNLDNKQQSIINTANTLAKFEQTNVDNRMAAAIQNAKAFMDMDMKNLDNEQQARVINNQNRVQSILEDAKAKNAERLFVSSTQADMDKFYDSLNTQIKQYNSSQNLDAQKFNSTLSDSREKFYKEMQYNIAISNAKWRQEVQLNEDQQAHEAATIDVKNMVDISNTQLAQLWDRSDSLLDYAWKSSENEQERLNKLAQVALAGKLELKAKTMEGLGLLAGAFVGSDFFSDGLKSLFG